MASVVRENTGIWISSERDRARSRRSAHRSPTDRAPCAGAAAEHRRQADRHRRRSNRRQLAWRRRIGRRRQRQQQPLVLVLVGDLGRPQREVGRQPATRPQTPRSTRAARVQRRVERRTMPQRRAQERDRSRSRINRQIATPHAAPGTSAATSTNRRRAPRHERLRELDRAAEHATAAANSGGQTRTSGRDPLRRPACPSQPLTEQPDRQEQQHVRHAGRSTTTNRRRSPTGSRTAPPPSRERHRVKVERKQAAPDRVGDEAGGRRGIRHADRARSRRAIAHGIDRTMCGPMTVGDRDRQPRPQRDRGAVFRIRGAQVRQLAARPRITYSQ